MLEQKDIQAIAELIHASEERMTERMTGKINEAITASEERMTERMTGKINEAITASEERMTERMTGKINEAITASEERMTGKINEAITASEERMTERMTGKINEAITASENRMKIAIRNSEKRTINRVNLILGVHGELEERIAPLEESVAELKLWRETQKSKNQDYDTLQMQIDDLRNKFELEMQTRKSA